MIGFSIPQTLHSTGILTLLVFVEESFEKILMVEPNENLWNGLMIQIQFS